MNIGKNIATNIRRLADRDRGGLGINKLADFSGVSRSQMYDVIGCKKSPTTDWLDPVAEVLGVHVADLMRKQAKRKKN